MRGPTRSLENVQRLNVRLHMQDPELACIDENDGGPSSDLDVSLLYSWSIRWIERQVMICLGEVCCLLWTALERLNKALDTEEWMVGLKKRGDKVLAVAATAYFLVGRIRAVIDGISQKVQDGEWKQTGETE